MKTIYVKIKPEYAVRIEQAATALATIGTWGKNDPENTVVVEIEDDTVVLSAKDNLIGFSTYPGTESVAE